MILAKISRLWGPKGLGCECSGIWKGRQRSRITASPKGTKTEKTLAADAYKGRPRPRHHPRRAEVVRDEGTNAKNLDRPGLARLVAVVEVRQIDVVMVCKLDRLTRSVADLDKLMRLFERHKVALVCPQENLDATVAMGRLMINLLASASQWEREVIGERTRDAMQRL